jgi:polyketide synthase PksN
MRAYLEKHEVDLTDFAYTLQVGRDEMPERLALVASSVEDLKHKFEEILEGPERPKDVWRNNIGNRETKVPTADDAQRESLIRELIERKELSGLAELWISGAIIDWRLLHKSGAPRRISIPTYPFARERYWFPEDKTTKERHEQQGGSEPILAASRVDGWSPAHLIWADEDDMSIWDHLHSR